MLVVYTHWIYAFGYTIDYIIYINGKEKENYKIIKKNYISLCKITLVFKCVYNEKNKRKKKMEKKPN